MDLSIKKSTRASGLYFHKMPRNTSNDEAKKQASKDITSFCTESNSFYTKNYISIENIVLTACKCKMQIFSINTSIL